MKKRYHWLASVINENRYTIGAEVGTATGNTTAFLLTHCPKLKRLYAVDDWRPIPGSGQWEREDMERVFMQKIGWNKRITVLKGLSWEMAKEVPDKSLDFAFIDASHDYESAKKDMNAWKSKVKPSGMLCGHDLHFPGVQQALAEAPFPFEIAGIDNCWYTTGKWL